MNGSLILSIASCVLLFTTRNVRGDEVTVCKRRNGGLP